MRPQPKLTKIFICLIIIWTNLTKVQAEQSKSDSLIALIKKLKASSVELNNHTLSLKDTVLINLYNDLATELMYSDPDNAIKKADSAYLMSKKISYSYGWANAYRVKGIVNYLKGEFPQAHANLDSALILAKKIKNEALIARLYRNKGNTYTYQSNYTEALKMQFNALRIYEKLKDEEGIGSTYLNLGSIYTSQVKYEQALENYKKSMGYMRRLHDLSGESIILMNVGIINMYQNKTDSALKYFNDAKEIFIKIGDKFSYAEVHSKIGLAYKRINDFTSALKYYNLSLQYAEETGNKKLIAANLNNIGIVLIELKKYQEAESALNRAIEISLSNRDHGFLYNHFQTKARLDSISGNFKKALTDVRTAFAYQDSIDNNENTRRQTEAEMNYKFEKKVVLLKAEEDRKLAIEKIKSERQKSIKNIITVGLILTIILLVMLYFQSSKTKKEKKRSDDLLLNILPSDVAEELKAKGSAVARQYDDACVMFTDFVGFTQISEKITPSELLTELNFYFTEFDRIIDKYGLEKIKTIGDAYMAVGGMYKNTGNASVNTTLAALEIIQFMNQVERPVVPFKIKIGIHTGPVITGIVGVKKFAYDVWGDTVNTAARLEQTSETGKINISSATYHKIKHKFECHHRGKLMVKNKGEIDMYYVEKEI